MDSAVDHMNLPPEHRDYLQVFYFVIGSPESLVALQEIIKSRRIATAGKELGVCWELSTADGIRAIESIDLSVAYLVLRGRCHVYRLYCDCSKDSQKTSDGWVVNTAQSMLRQNSTQIGNPRNLEDARVVENIMTEVYPHVKPGTMEYQQKRRFVVGLRKLGERLDLLVKSFGYGILGLLSWPEGKLSDSPRLIVNDGM